ncbi:non-ribosomal peptide synthetase, partial [Chitinophagaceae bacterium LB-8]
PIGVVGEICVGGAGLARGYLNREELTREKFIASPFKAGARLYRTGDMGRWLQDGSIEYLGRRDEQVKIRGYRIELGEIESVVLQRGGVRQCVVVAKEEEEGSRKRLVGYVVAEEALNKEALIDYLKARLPEYMVPLQWVQLEQLPLTANGKVDRRALPQVEVGATSRYVAPTNEVQQQLVQIWQQLLKVTPIGIHDNFFELGGHSLMATRLLSAIRKDFKIDISIREFFNNSTVVGIEDEIEKANWVAVKPITDDFDNLEKFSI